MLLKRDKLSAGDRDVIARTVAFLCGGEVPQPKIQWDRLDEGEQDELRRLVGRLYDGDHDGIDRSTLDAAATRRFERLIAIGAGFDPDRFQQRREEEEMAVKARDREARERRLPFTKRETTNLLLAWFEALDEDDAWVDDVAVMTVILAQFASGRTLISTSYFEGSAATDDLALVVNANYGLAGDSDGASTLAGWKARVDFLADERWLSVVKSGPTWKLSPGAKLLNVFRQIPVDAEMAS
jgi:hypothetical protein